jgi:purine-binding chemotaxis protein CheW
MPDPSVLRLLLWRAGSLRCGAPIEHLAQVLPRQSVTTIPEAAPAVRGVTNVRGALVTVVDGRTLVGEPDDAPGGDLILVRRGTGVIGLEVDEVEDIVGVPDGALVPAASGAAWEARVDDGAPARLLDLDALLAPLFPD